MLTRITYTYYFSNDINCFSQIFTRSYTSVHHWLGAIQRKHVLHEFFTTFVPNKPLTPRISGVQPVKTCATRIFHLMTPSPNFIFLGVSTDPSPVRNFTLLKPFQTICNIRVFESGLYALYIFVTRQPRKLKFGGHFRIVTTIITSPSPAPLAPNPNFRSPLSNTLILQMVRNGFKSVKLLPTN